MNYCFLFTQYLSDEGCHCLTISQDGALLAPFTSRTFDQIRTLQKECKTFIIEPALKASILELELPWLPERKARAAIPFALEDKLAQNLEELHFSFDKLRYRDNKYLIVVTSKLRLQTLITLLKTEQIHFDLITLDWFALPENKSCISESTLLVYAQDFKGALSQEMAKTYLKKHPLTEPLLFTDSHLVFEHSLAQNPNTSFLWLAQQLAQTKPLNLVQGEFLQNSTSKWIVKGYQVVGLLVGIWLGSMLLSNALSAYFLNKKNEHLDQKIAVIYHQFFPEAKQVISPKFRITQLLGNQSSAGTLHFWNLLNLSATVFKENKVTIEEMRFQNNTLSLNLVSPDFASLEQVEDQLKKLNLKVRKTQASSQDQNVLATLELS